MTDLLVSVGFADEEERKDTSLQHNKLSLSLVEWKEEVAFRRSDELTAAFPAGGQRRAVAKALPRLRTLLQTDSDRGHWSALTSLKAQIANMKISRH